MGFLAALGGLAAIAVESAIVSCADDDKAENQRLSAQQSYEHQKKLEEMRAEEARKQRRHENTTMIINGIFSLLQSASDSSGTSTYGDE